MLAVIAATTNFAGSDTDLFSSLNPGPLSSVHSGFTRTEGCGACHIAHEQEGLGWLSAAFLPQDNAGQCLGCHSFGQPERGPHNTQHQHREDMVDIKCTACHTEHQGTDFMPSNVSNSVCGNCHQPAFESFETDHPAFAESYPYQVPNSINFDHVKHLGEYFVKDRWTSRGSRDADFAARAAKSCTTCHVVEAATREVQPLPFEEICARCHEQQITDRALVMFSPSEIYPVAAMLFQLDEDADDAEDQIILTTESLSEESIDFLASRLEKFDQEDLAAKLFTGLSTEVVTLSTAAWMDEEEYEPEHIPDINVKGWLAGEDPDGGQSVHYRPTGHRDPLIRAWIELALKLRFDEDSDVPFADYALEHLLDDSEGPGACGKCHAAGVSSLMSESARGPQWSYRGSVERPHTLYRHAPHINLLGPDNSCKTCHVLDEDADYAAYYEDPERSDSDFQSNFTAIKKSTCDVCHQRGIVRTDCQLCHQYHRAASFKVNFQRAKSKSN